MNTKRGRESAAYRHGHGDRKNRSPEYSVWMAINTRCHNPNSTGYWKYGARGITVCAEWRDFVNFLRDMGARPSMKHTIDRKDNNGNYEPGNCRWATKTEQTLNRTATRYITHAGETLCVAHWAQRAGLRPGTVFERLKRGWSVADALTVPPVPSNGATSNRTRETV